MNYILSEDRRRALRQDLLVLYALYGSWLNAVHVSAFTLALLILPCYHDCMRRISVGLFLIVLAIVSTCSTSSVVYDIHPDKTEEYLLLSYETATLIAKGQEELSRCESIVISWKGGDEHYTFILSTDEDFSSYRAYGTETNSISLVNLFTGTDYYWRVKETGEEGMFTVSDHAPRLISVGGVTNFRDIGGWMTESGKRVKQGLLYRSARLSENVTAAPLITDTGRAAVVNDLSIRTELDLRDTKDNEYGGLEESVIGENVRYIHYPMKSGGNYLVLNLSVLPGLFEILSDADNYPLVFHCSIGTDRTGVVAFLVNGLLGVGEEDLYRDYLLSNFADISVMRNRNDIRDYIKYMDRYPGDTLSERIENFLVANGVNEESIAKIRELLLEP